MHPELIDFHTHSFHSDGALCPAELVQRLKVAGYRAVAITDHADASNLSSLVASIVGFCRDTQKYLDIQIIPGVELTHVPPGQVAMLTDQAREMGAVLVLLHGESPAEPVAPGTNRAGIEAKVDVLAHPGCITEEEVRLAKSNGVHLELTARPPHGMTNGHVAKLAGKIGARLVINSDYHSPGDQLSVHRRELVALGAGLDRNSLKDICKNMSALIQNITTKGAKK